MRIPFIDRKELLNDQNFETEAIDESSEFLKAVGSSDRTVQMIPISRIRMNPKNDRSLAGTEVLKESIRRAGRLFEPLLVYEAEGSYCLISGHRRYTAWKSLCDEPDSSWNTSIPCMVVPRPKDEFEERILMSQANIHRSDPEEIRTEVRIAMDIWGSMSENQMAEMKELLKDRFLKDLGKEVTNEYLRANFRPRLEFVRYMTGITSTNKTIQNMLKDPKKGPAKSPATVTKKRLLREVKTLANDLETYEIPDGVRDDKEKFIQFLKMLGEAIEHAW